jgi:polyhydroxyalkanoate synthase subunit PhaC
VAAPVDVGDLLNRAKRDVERARFRARNGIRLIVGTDQPYVGLTPRDEVWARDKVRLYRYHGDHRAFGDTPNPGAGRPPVLLVMSLISRHYIFDLQPKNSCIEFLLGQGLDVFLLDWGVPDELESDFTLATYCDDYLPRAVSAVAAEAGSEAVTVYGYCLGGVLALLYAAGHPDDPVANLITMATPVDFSGLGPLSALMDGRVPPEDLVDATGNVPPGVIFNAFRTLAPTGEIVNYANLWQHLWNDRFVDGYQAMNGWVRDHIPFPGGVLRDMAELVSTGGFTRGEAPLGRRRVRLADITCPFLSVLAEADHIVPVDAAAGLADLVGSKDATELRLPGGHVSLFVGRPAQTRSLPAIVDWIAHH